MNIQFFNIVSIFLLATSIFGQIIAVKNLSVDDGLVYSQVLCAYQDKNGYMWFGTSSGISCWDGRRFENFHSTNKIRFDNVKLISENEQGDLHLITRNNLLIRRNNDFVIQTNLPAPLQQWIEYSVADDSGHTYLASQDSGIWKFDGEIFSKILSATDLQGATVSCLFFSKDQSLLIGTNLSGVFELEKDKGLKKILTAGVSPQNVSTLHVDANGIVYIGTKNDGLFTSDGNRLILPDYSSELPGKEVKFIYGDSNNRIYIATDEGIAVMQNGTIRSVISSKNGLANDFVWWIYEDSQNNIYFCTDGGGVDIYRPGVYETYDESIGLPDNTVWSILEAEDSQFYIATDRGVAQLTPSGFHILSTKTGLSEDMIITLYRSQDGHIFFGTNESGVDILKNGRLEHFDTRNGLTSNSVWSIAEDEAGRVYFGTYDGGINVYQGGRIIDTMNTDDGLANNFIVSAYTAPDGTVYFGLDNGGLYHLVDGVLHSDEVLFSGMTVWSVYQRDDGTLFFGTDKNGLIVHSPFGTDTLTIQNGLSNNAILGIMESEDGKLYLTTDNGLNVLDYSTAKPYIRIITSDDGLPSNECNQGAYLRDSEGYLWIGTIRGVTRYNPAADVPPAHPPRTHITQMKVFDRDIPLTSNASKHLFAHNENYIQFYFTGIDLTAPHKVHYRYRLNGSDHEWLETDYPQVQYANLDDQDYIFEIQAGNEWESWGEIASVQFTILPPFWETWWFRLLVILCVGGLVSVFIFLRVRSLLEIEKVRAKIAADLHDDIGAGLSEINILSAVAEAKTPPEAKHFTENELGKIAQTARQMIENMSDIVWMVNPKNDSMSGLISRLKDSFNEVLDAQGIKFQLKNINLLENLKLSMEKRQYLFLIFKEALNNAVKYSACSEINLEINLEHRIVTIILNDNGKGFDLNKIRSGNGLNNMRTRSQKIKGRLEIKSTMNKGTQIVFTGKLN